MEKADLVYYRLKVDYEKDLKLGKIQKGSIVFVEDTGQIFTQKGEFNTPQDNSQRVRELEWEINQLRSKRRSSSNSKPTQPPHIPGFEYHRPCCKSEPVVTLREYFQSNWHPFMNKGATLY